VFSSLWVSHPIARSQALWFEASSHQAYFEVTSRPQGLGLGLGAVYTIEYSCLAASDLQGTLYDTGGNTGNYGNSEYRVTPLRCPPGYELQLKFLELRLTSSIVSTCDSDSISIYYGDSLFKRYTYCVTESGTQLPEVGAVGSSAVVIFSSDSSITNSGYSLNYECSLKESGNDCTQTVPSSPCPPSALTI
jgi:hypothetical protein